ncbi:MAG: hypothetical protein BWY72_02562 [Bacteroidetes bacterium ADurb.Bin416]|nr:MAG: hypothetical protein BWY72_02562 [Bacteroidetes bacterium ADurb.Bin416]
MRFFDSVVVDVAPIWSPATYALALSLVVWLRKLATVLLSNTAVPVAWVYTPTSAWSLPVAVEEQLMLAGVPKLPMVLACRLSVPAPQVLYTP